MLNSSESLLLHNSSFLVSPLVLIFPSWHQNSSFSEVGLFHVFKNAFCLYKFQQEGGNERQLRVKDVRIKCNHKKLINPRKKWEPARQPTTLLASVTRWYPWNNTITYTFLLRAKDLLLKNNSINSL